MNKTGKTVKVNNAKYKKQHKIKENRKEKWEVKDIHQKDPSKPNLTAKKEDD